MPSSDEEPATSRNWEWSGIHNPEALQPEALARSHAIADAARDYQWLRLLELLGSHPARVNEGRVGGHSGYAPLHQVAHGGAPVEVAKSLLLLGAGRTLRTAEGERPLDMAQRLGHTHLLEVLTPAPSLPCDPDKLAQVEVGVHAMIRGRAAVQPLLERAMMQLPPLDLLTEAPGNSLWFPVPGMYGGFHLQLGQVVDEPICVVDSWCRVVGGSEERRLVSRGGTVELRYDWS